MATDLDEAERLARELAERDRMRKALRGQLFDLQLEAYDDPAQFKALHPGRRGGKSEGIPRWALLDALDAGFEEYVVIGAETQKKARALHWYKLKRAAKAAGIQLDENKQEGTFRTPWGAVIFFWGIADEGAVDMLRGFSVKAAYFDEVASYAGLLKYLVQDVMHPALATTGGKLWLCGTPSITRAGEWFEICKGREKHNWSVKHWKMLQNRCFPGGLERAREQYEKARARYGANSATFMREWDGEFVDDPSMQVYAYTPERNDIWCDEPPGYDRETWVHSVAVDFGMTNACAWTAGATAPHSRRLYGLRSAKQVGLLTGQAARETMTWCEQYKPHRLVGDAGGLGKAYVEEWNRRYAGRTRAEIEALTGVDEGDEERVKLPPRRPDDYTMPVMLAAEKTDKRGAIEFVNSELGCDPPGILLCQPGCAPLSEEMLSLPWADETKQKEKAGYQNHCSDTLVYLERTHMAYLNEAPPPPPRDRKRMAPDDPEVIERERDQIRREAAADWWDEKPSEDSGRSWWDA